MNRLRIFVLFAAMLVLAVGLAACGSSGGPQAVVDEATLEGVESGDLDLSIGFDVKGGKGGHVDVKVEGPFQSEAGAELPKLDLTASATGTVEGKAVDFEGGLTLLGGIHAYVGYEGVEYKVDPVTFGFVRGMMQETKSGEPNELTACQQAVAGLDIGDFVEGATEEGTADVGGTETTKVSGELDTAGAIDALIELTEDPACGEQLDAAPGALPSTAQLEKAKGEVQGAVKKAHVELYVGDDHIVRRLTAQATIEPREQSGGGGAESVDLDVDLTLTGVNEPQTIAAPAHSQPLTNLFLKLGISPFELLEVLEGKGGRGRGGINGLLEAIGGAGSNR
ncbi:MAG TPA: hypothetical protein VF245_07215 [Solirubrobacterales bacterium]